MPNGIKTRCPGNVNRYERGPGSEPRSLSARFAQFAATSIQRRRFLCNGRLRIDSLFDQDDPIAVLQGHGANRRSVVDGRAPASR